MAPAAPPEDVDEERVGFTPADREAAAGTGHGEASAGGTPAGAPPRYEEVTLTDLVLTLVDHWVPALVVLLLVVGGTAAYTFAQPTMYSSSATFVPLSEEDALVELMSSRSYAMDVADRLGLVGELGGGDEARAGDVLRSRVSVTRGSGPVGGQQEPVVTVTATMGSPARAAEVANAYVDAVDLWRPQLENVTWARNWETYYEGTGNDTAGYNASLARERLTDLVEGMVYVQPLDPAQPPESASSPNVELNMALGATLGLMLAFMTPFVLEAATNVAAELRTRKGPKP